jgi:hypothetical protein
MASIVVKTNFGARAASRKNEDAPRSDDFNRYYAVISRGR